MQRWLKLMVTGCLLCSFVAESAIIRNGGRGSETSTSPNSYYLIDDGLLTTHPLTGELVIEGYSASSVLSSSPRKSTTSGKYKLLVVPFDGCATEYDFGFYYGVPPEFQPNFGGCEWQFSEDERLFVYGDFPMFLPGAFAYDIKFTISDNAGTQWVLDGADTYVDNVGGAPLPDGGYSNQGMVFLDAQRPADLVAGEYTISVSVTMFSGPNSSFHHYYDENSGYQVACEDVADPSGAMQEFCFVASGISQSDTLSFSADFAETLRIVPANAPASLALFMGGLCLMTLRRTRLKKLNQQ